jgi:hypothetical protein
MRLIVVLALALTAFLASPEIASAQDRDLLRRTELAERYIRLSFGDDLRPMIEAVIEEQLAADGSMTPEERTWYRNNMPIFFDQFMTELIDLMAPRYAAIMTDEELNAGIDFFGSPLGRSLARKEVSLQVGMEEEVYAAAEAMVVDMETKYCAAFTCPDLIQVVPSGK